MPFTPFTKGGDKEDSKADKAADKKAGIKEGSKGDTPKALSQSSGSAKPKVSQGGAGFGAFLATKKGGK